MQFVFHQNPKRGLSFILYTNVYRHGPFWNSNSNGILIIPTQSEQQQKIAPAQYVVNAYAVFSMLQRVYGSVECTLCGVCCKYGGATHQRR